MNRLILNILSLVMSVSKCTKHDVFFNFHGNCNCITIEVYENGFGSGSNPIIFEVYMEHMNTEEILEKLFEVKKYLDRLLEF